MSITIADLIFLINGQPAIPIHAGCTVTHSEDRVVDQVCPSTAGPQATAEIRTYRGRAIKSELRTGSFAACHQLHKGLTVSAGGNVPFLGEGAWDMRGFQVSWSYDGSVCRLYQNYDTPEMRVVVDTILDTNVKKED